MNKKIKVLLIAAALMLPAMVATAATAGPDCDNERFFDHPLCETSTPTTTTTTTTTEPPIANACSTVTTLRGSGHMDVACDWTVAQSSATSATVTITVVSGEIFRVVQWVRDSDPGDICILKQWDKEPGEAGAVFTVSFPLVYEDGTTFWEHGGTNWCEPFDGTVGQRVDLNGAPLHVSMGFRATKGTVVEITLSPGQAAG